VVGLVSYISGGTAGPLRVSLEVSGHGQSSYQVKDEATTAAAVDFFNREGGIRRKNRHFNRNNEEVTPVSLIFQ
jgi:hypothetical protein